jgi:hypothetical protein
MSKCKKGRKLRVSKGANAEKLKVMKAGNFHHFLLLGEKMRKWRLL